MLLGAAQNNVIYTGQVFDQKRLDAVQDSLYDNTVPVGYNTVLKKSSGDALKKKALAVAKKKTKDDE